MGSLQNEWVFGAGIPGVKRRGSSHALGPELWYDSRMRELADKMRVQALVDDLAQRIRADVASPAAGPAAGRWAIVGIKSRGDVLARRLAQALKPDHFGSLDITLYRDDLSEIGAKPIVRTTDIPFSVDGLSVVLVDDVLMSGRSVRAALQALMDFGRPRRVWLSVLVDRGGRELPIRPDHVALDLSSPSAKSELQPSDRVKVLLEPTDPLDAIVVQSVSATGQGVRA